MKAVHERFLVTLSHQNSEESVNLSRGNRSWQDGAFKHKKETECDDFL